MAISWRQYVPMQKYLYLCISQDMSIFMLLPSGEGCPHYFYFGKKMWKQHLGGLVSNTRIAWVVLRGHVMFIVWQPVWQCCSFYWFWLVFGQWSSTAGREEIQQARPPPDLILRVSNSNASSGRPLLSAWDAHGFLSNYNVNHPHFYETLREKICDCDVIV